MCIAAANVSTVCSDERTCRNSEGACFTCGLLRTDNFRNDNNSVNEDLELLAEYRRLDTVKSMKHPRVGAGGRYSVVRHDSRVREWLDNIGEDVQMQVDEAVHDAAKYFGPVRPNRWCSGLTPSLTILDGYLWHRERSPSFETTLPTCVGDGRPCHRERHRFRS